MTMLPARSLWLGVALAAGGLLLAAPAPGRKPAAPVSATIAWAHAQRDTIPANLSDGTTYTPAIFLDAHTSVGTAESRDGKFLRLMLTGADAPARQLRILPAAQHPSFQTFALDRDVLAWAEGTDDGHVRLWTVNVRDGRPARLLTADTGQAAFYQSQYDLVIADGGVHWAARGRGGTTEIRSVALTGGPVAVRMEPGTWQLSAWPWLVNGVNQAAGATALRNMATGQEVTVAKARKRATTDCSPSWCVVVSLSDDGLNRLELMRPDGSSRKRISADAATAIADVAPLDRFEVFSQVGPNSELTGTSELLVYETATRRTVEINPSAGKVFYRAGVLSWSTGNLESSVWHTIDLRTV
jgi:hypothetical protein